MNPRSALPQYIDRRRMLTIVSAGLGTVIVAACAGDSITDDPTSTPTASSDATMPGPDTTAPITDSTTSDARLDCVSIPAETAGPFPGDGSNGPDVLSIDGVERNDIRASIGDASGTAAGTQLTIELTIVDSTTACSPMAGAAVYLWHADREGRYSMYSSGVSDENYLRGVQVADANGRLSFVSVFPGCYDGRWPHVHFEVYATRADVDSGRPLVTSQLAFPAATCEVAYDATGYEQSASNLTRVSLESDMVFRDGADQQLAAMSGNSTEGFTAALTVVV